MTKSFRKIFIEFLEREYPDAVAPNKIIVEHYKKQYSEHSDKAYGSYCTLIAEYRRSVGTTGFNKAPYLKGYTPEEKLFQPIIDIIKMDLSDTDKIELISKILELIQKKIT